MLSMLGLLLLQLVLTSAQTPSSADCTWKFVEQPLSHFARGIAGTYKQRLCVYEGYWTPDAGLPVFLYTGNESPVEEYVNNTGLLWDLAKEMNALVVFAEHRYFGESVPLLQGVDNCIAFLSSEEALADYAALVGRIRLGWGAKDSAVVAFGGSYGGMLAAWLRIAYPSAVDGAIAASAPVWGFPLDGTAVDSSARVVTYAASAQAGAAPRCAENLKAAYVLLSDIGSTEWGREMVSQTAGLCTPLQSAADVSQLLSYLQSPLFDLSEGSYPFPSDYITFALTGTDAPLPPWAMQVMCSAVEADFNTTIEGDTSDVRFSVTAGGVGVQVDWDSRESNGYSAEQVGASGALELIAAAARGVQVWYNVTGEMACADWSLRGQDQGQGQKQKQKQKQGQRRSLSRQARAHAPASTSVSASASASSTAGAPTSTSTTCTASTLDAGTAWNALVCNDGINLVNWWAQGVGADLYWPPNQPRNYTMQSLVPLSLDFCAFLGQAGLYGAPSKGDVWAEWLDTVYGGTRIQYASNIVFSNGDLDPWSPAGVQARSSGDRGGGRGTDSRDSSRDSSTGNSASLSNDGSVVSLSIAMGGHHLDLFWPTDSDPQSVREVRAVERQHVQRWIDQVRERAGV